MKSIEDNNIKSIICSYLPISEESKQPMFTLEQLEVIDACSSIRGTFRQLRIYLRWDDHLILNAVIHRLDSESCEGLFTQFGSKIDGQMKLEQIFENCKKQKLIIEVPKGFEKWLQ